MWLSHCVGTLEITVQNLGIQYDFKDGVSSVSSDWMSSGDMLPTGHNLPRLIANILSRLLLP